MSPEGRGDDVVREDVPDDVQLDVHLVGSCSFLSLTYPYRYCNCLSLYDVS